MFFRKTTIPRGQSADALAAIAAPPQTQLARFSELMDDWELAEVDLFDLLDAEYAQCVPETGDIAALVDEQAHSPTFFDRNVFYALNRNAPRSVSPTPLQLWRRNVQANEECRWADGYPSDVRTEEVVGLDGLCEIEVGENHCGLWENQDVDTDEESDSGIELLEEQIEIMEAAIADLKTEVVEWQWTAMTPSVI